MDSLLARGNAGRCPAVSTNTGLRRRTPSRRRLSSALHAQAVYVRLGVDGSRRAIARPPLSVKITDIA